MANPIDVGQTITLNAKFRDRYRKSVPVDNLQLFVTPPDGEEVELTSDIAEMNIGEYEVALVCDQVGQWYYRWTGSREGAPVAKDDIFLVQNRYETLS